ncbi:hypothetical protein WK57_30480 [Burkholderia ubonensis]|uniref:Uncharacterized protein n=1 Tax=Burkholderia ubonensis TaxID=101571 RepID=A0AA40R533_9BURK|nr:hypothetical protein [Burkholderia ubonensis]KWZ53317.1 hypothetical protein WK57_30480 [Burkholderia ubonensis]
MHTETKVVHESPLGRLTLRSAAREDADAARVPMFRSMDAALAFAYTWRARPGVKIGQIGEYTGPDGSALLLTIHEKKAQAQFILDVVESHLSLDQRAVLDASYGGERGERPAAIDRLLPQFEHVNRNRALVRMLLMREFIFGEDYCPSQQQVAIQCGVNRSTACRADAQIVPAIAALREATHAKLRPAFERRGWIGREAEK